MNNRKLVRLVSVLVIFVVAVVNAVDKNRGVDEKQTSAVDAQKVNTDSGSVKDSDNNVAYASLLMQNGREGMLLRRKGYLACYDASMRIPH